MTTTPLATLHRRRFDEARRARGGTYFRQRRVELTDVTEKRVTAVVRGGSRYEVTIRDYRDPEGVRWSCTCPYASGELACKHLWAVLLAVDEMEAGIAVVEARERAATASGAGADEAGAEVDPADDDDFEDFDDFDEEDDEDEADEIADEDPVTPAPRRRGVPPPLRLVSPAAPKQPAAGWQQRFARLLPTVSTASASPAAPRLEYVVIPGQVVDDAVMTVQVHVRQPLKGGGFGVPRAVDLRRSLVSSLPPADRALLAAIERCRNKDWMANYFAGARPWLSLRQPVGVTSDDLEPVAALLAATGRVSWQPGLGAASRPLSIDGGEPFRFRLLVLGVAANDQRRQVVGMFCRDTQCLTALECGRVAVHDMRIVADRLIRIDCGEAVDVANEFARGPLEVDAAEVPAVLGTLARLPGARAFLGDLVGELPAVPPGGVLCVTLPKDAAAPLSARLRFDYQGELLDATDERPLLATREGLCRRDLAAEQALSHLVLQHGVTTQFDGSLQLPRDRLAATTAALAAVDVRVLAEGRRLRAFRSGSSNVATGIDWFELGGKVAFEAFEAQLPELLARPVTPDGFVELGDGSLGMLPANWLRRLEAMRALGGETVGDVVRVPSSRALLLDALLSAQEQGDVVVDAAFAKMRARLAAFTHVEPVREPTSFAGELRPYQRDGLGWLRFLREFGLGGCLADDMGLGKTVQVLAHLCAALDVPARGARRKQRSLPNLLVAPRSVLGNWQAEAARFAPGLRVLDFSTPDRWHDGAEDRLRTHDLVLTTYALLRVDAPAFVDRKIAFDHAILDEAQAVKNPDSQSSKAVRLLTARHRLVLTGTPVENQIGDLWSLFEFLNPGMLGRLPAFRALFGKDSSGEAMAQHRELVQRALRPVLLRRTKQQVLKDLPEKVEQTLWCELGPAQRKRYDALRRHYQKLLLGKTGELDGTQRFVVLEALLRLRQAACHEALLPGGPARAESAKFEELLPRLEELAAEGHKALVFSQFTSVLDLLEPLLRERGLDFERLDGQTRRRSERVQRFQEDAKCPLFLISLKAGGYGLNLTAAGYVFLLDPWWNPAVEMQAIDRAHRIGQTRTVNAYRLVCRGTVEERVLELQAQKKALVEAILGNERSLLQDLTRADLELLLG